MKLVILPTAMFMILPQDNALTWERKLQSASLRAQRHHHEEVLKAAGGRRPQCVSQLYDLEVLPSSQCQAGVCSDLCPRPLANGGKENTLE